MVRDTRTERSTAMARQIGDVVEWTEVLQHKFKQVFVHQNGDLVLVSLQHAQPMEADKRVGDVVRSTKMVHQFRGCIQQ